jgi:integrase
MQRSGVTRLTPHALRHTYASILIHAGENLLYVRDRLGHASIKVTMDTYGHLLPVGVRSRLERLDDAEWNATQMQPSRYGSSGCLIEYLKYERKPLQ